MAWPGTAPKRYEAWSESLYLQQHNHPFCIPFGRKGNHCEEKVFIVVLLVINDLWVASQHFVLYLPVCPTYLPRSLSSNTTKVQEKFIAVLRWQRAMTHRDGAANEWVRLLRSDHLGKEVILELGIVVMPHQGQIHNLGDAARHVH